MIVWLGFISVFSTILQINQINCLIVLFSFILAFYGKV